VFTTPNSVSQFGALRCGAKELKSYIKVVGPNNVTQICLDIASVMLGAPDELVSLYLHLYKQGCHAHILDLLLKNRGIEEIFKTLITRAKQVCIYIQNHHVTMALYCPLFTNVVIKSTTGDEICMKLPHNCLHA
jgi:hypothetical protein